MRRRRREIILQNPGIHTHFPQTASKPGLRRSDLLLLFSVEEEQQRSSPADGSHLYLHRPKPGPWGHGRSVHRRCGRGLDTGSDGSRMGFLFLEPAEAQLASLLHLSLRCVFQDWSHDLDPVLIGSSDAQTPEAPGGFPTCLSLSLALFLLSLSLALSLSQMNV